MALELLPLSSLSAGMTLAADVVGLDGRVLLPRGAVLTERHLQILNDRGVKKAAIVKAGAELPERATQAQDAQLKEKEISPEVAAVTLRLNRVFAQVRGDALMEELYKLAMARAERIKA